MIKTTQIKIGNLKFNGKDCQDPVVSYIGAGNLAIKCIDDKNQIYSVQTLDTGADAKLPDCLTFVVSCGECSECESKVVEVCLCETASDCGPCQDCIDGTCVDRCKPGQQCVNGRCTDCKSDDDCDCNQICLPNGGCACPSNTTINPRTNCCDSCEKDADCNDPCLVCENVGGINMCIPKPCDGVCDPETGDCVECLSDKDCVNKSCKYCDTELNKCVAIPGVQLQVSADQCIETPECIDDRDCSNCEYCGKNGKCAPVLVCSPDQILDTKNCKCVEKCDCTKQNCPEGYYCGAVDSFNNCGCFKCEGDCDSGCKPPCFCSEILDKCIANPCSNKPCVDGIDCGPGCGCIGGKCVPCQSQDCNSLNPSCLTVKGCICSGNQCIGDDCGRAPCANINDCGEGCTCYEGECTGCSNFSCNGVNNCAQQVGCKCVNGNCVDDPDGRDCKDTIDMDATEEGCNLIGMLTKETPCYCTHLVINAGGKQISSDADSVTMEYVVQIRKNVVGPGYDIGSLPLLTDSGHPDVAENEVPVTGSFKLSVRVEESYTVNGQPKEAVREIAGTTATFPSSGNNAAVAVFPTVKIPKINSTYIDAQGNERTIDAVKVSVLRNNTIVVDNNECKYLNEDGTTPFAIYNIAVNSDFSWSETAYNRLQGKQITSATSRRPMFTWYKNSQIIRQVYVPLADGVTDKYVDILDQTEYKLKSCDEYMLEVDCTCESPLQKIFVWKKGSIQIKSEECGKAFKVTNFETCQANLSDDTQFYLKWGTQEHLWTPGSTMDFPSQIFRNDDKCVGEIDWGIKCGNVYHSFDQKVLIPCNDYRTPLISAICNSQTGKLDLTFPQQLIDSSGNAVNVVRVYLTPADVEQWSPYNSFAISVEPGYYRYRLETSGQCNYESSSPIGGECCEGKNLAPDYWSKFTRNPDNTISGTVKPNRTFTIGSNPQVYNSSNILLELNTIDSSQSITVVEEDDIGCTKTHTIDTGCTSWAQSTLLTIPSGTDISTYYVSLTSGSTANSTLTVIPSTGINVIKQNDKWQITGLQQNQSYQIEVRNSLCPGVKTTTINNTGTSCNHSVDLNVSPSNCNALVTTVNNVTSCKCNDYRVQLRARVTDASAWTNDMDAEFVVQMSDVTGMTIPEMNSGTGCLVVTVDQTQSTICCIGDNNVPGTCSGTMKVPLAVIENCFDDAVLKVNAIPSGGPGGSSYIAKLSIKYQGTSYFDDFDGYEISRDGGATYQPVVNRSFSGTPGESVILRLTEVTQSSGTYVATVNIASVNAGEIDIPISNWCNNSQDIANNYMVKMEFGDVKFVDNCQYLQGTNQYEFSFNSLDLQQSLNTAWLRAERQESPVSANSRFKRYRYFEVQPDGSNPVTILEVWDSNTQHLLGAQYTDLGKSYQSKVWCNCEKESPIVAICCLPEITIEDQSCRDSVTVKLTGSPGDYDLIAGFSGASPTGAATEQTAMVTIPQGQTEVTHTFNFTGLNYATNYYVLIDSPDPQCQKTASWSTPPMPVITMTEECINQGVLTTYDMAIGLELNGQSTNAWTARLKGTIPAGVTWDAAARKIRGIDGNTMNNQTVTIEVTVTQTGDYNNCIAEKTFTIQDICMLPQSMPCPQASFPNAVDINALPVDQQNQWVVEWPTVNNATQYGIYVYNASGGLVFAHTFNGRVGDLMNAVNLLDLFLNNLGAPPQAGQTYSIEVVAVDPNGVLSDSENCTQIVFGTAQAASCQAVISADGQFISRSLEYAIVGPDSDALLELPITYDNDPDNRYDFTVRWSAVTTEPTSAPSILERREYEEKVHMIETRFHATGILPNSKIKTLLVRFGPYVNNGNWVGIPVSQYETSAVNQQCPGCQPYSVAQLPAPPLGQMTKSWLDNQLQFIINAIAKWQEENLGAVQFNVGADYFLFGWAMVPGTSQNPHDVRIGTAKSRYDAAVPGFGGLVEIAGISWTFPGDGNSTISIRVSPMPTSWFANYPTYPNWVGHTTNRWLTMGNIWKATGELNACSGTVSLEANVKPRSACNMLAYGDTNAGGCPIALVGGDYPPTPITENCEVHVLNASVSGCSEAGPPRFIWKDETTGQIVGEGPQITIVPVTFGATYTVTVQRCCTGDVEENGIAPV